MGSDQSYRVGMDVSVRQDDGGWEARTPAVWAGVRGLILGWCLWLLGSWAATLWIAATAPAVRWMVYASMVGMMLAWPAFRLSQGRGRAGVAAVSPMSAALGDWLSLNLVLQAVIWPLQLIAGWSLTQTLWLAGALASWSALIGVLIAVGRTCRGAGSRIVAMLGCVAVVLAEPVGRVLLSPGTGLSGGWGLSPVGPLWELTARRERFVLGELDQTVLLVAAASVVGWVVVWGLGRAGDRRAGAGGVGEGGGL